MLRRPFPAARLTVLGVLFVAVGLPGCGSSARSSASNHAPHSGHASGTASTGGPARVVPSLIPPGNPPAHSVTVPVLTYHRVHTMPAVGLPDLTVDPRTFAGELAALQAGGYHTVSQTQLFDALYRGKTLPAKPVIISVDDGYVDDIRTILPALKRYRMVATFFVITGRMTEPGFLTADQIRQIDRAGMDVGDHTAHHVNLRLLTPSELRVETAGSRQVLQHVLGHPVYYFAYPFGVFNSQVVDAVRAAGFTMAYTTAGGTTESTGRPLTMPRIHVGRSETPSGILSLLGRA